MNKAVKAALLSAFVFPGAGHVFLRRYIAASVFLMVSAVAFYILLAGLLAQAQTIADKMIQSGVQLDVAAISELVTQQSGVTDDGSSPALAVLVFFWLASIVDAYRLGQDRTAVVKPQRK